MSSFLAKKSPYKNQLLSVYLQYGEEQTITASFIASRTTGHNWCTRCISSGTKAQEKIETMQIHLGASLALCGEKSAIWPVWPAYGWAKNRRRRAFVFQFPADATRNVKKKLLNRVGPRIQENDTLWRKSLEPGLMLAITLRHLAAGDMYPTLQFGFRVARNTISTFIPELWQAIVEEYKDEVITCPTASNEWRDISKRVSDCVSSLSKVASLCV